MSNLYPMLKLDRTRQAFREAPSFDTAVAYMDAAIEEWQARWYDHIADIRVGKRSLDPADEQMRTAMQEIRDWLAIPR